MNDLYTHQLETENKQLRIALQECRKALEEERKTKKKTIEYIKYKLEQEQEYQEGLIFQTVDIDFTNLLEILGDKENE